MHEVGSVASKEIVDKGESDSEFCSPAFLSVVQECLINFWMSQGMESDKAERAARKAVVLIRLNARKEKWCLLPDVSDD